MFSVYGTENNPNLVEVVQLGNFTVKEYISDRSSNFGDAANNYFASKMNVRARQLYVALNGNGCVLQSGAMQWTVGSVESVTNVKGAGDLFGKMLSSKVTGEAAIKPLYRGNGLLVSEPTYKHILLYDVNEWGSMTIEDGAFLACSDTVNIKTVMRKTLSSAVAGGEGLFNMALTGSGVVALESSCPADELITIELQNDVLKIDGSMAVAWSTDLQFTVERSSKSLIGSSVNGEGLVNVYKGTGKIIMRPLR